MILRRPSRSGSSPADDLDAETGPSGRGPGPARRRRGSVAPPICSARQASIASSSTRSARPRADIGEPPTAIAPWLARRHAWSSPSVRGRVARQLGRPERGIRRHAASRPGPARPAGRGRSGPPGSAGAPRRRSSRTASGCGRSPGRPAGRRRPRGGSAARSSAGGGPPTGVPSASTRTMSSGVISSSSIVEGVIAIRPSLEARTHVAGRPDREAARAQQAGDPDDLGPGRRRPRPSLTTPAGPNIRRMTTRARPALRAVVGATCVEPGLLEHRDEPDVRERDVEAVGRGVDRVCLEPGARRARRLGDEGGEERGGDPAAAIADPDLEAQDRPDRAGRRASGSSATAPGGAGSAGVRNRASPRRRRRRRPAGRPGGPPRAAPAAPAAGRPVPRPGRPGPGRAAPGTSSRARRPRPARRAGHDRHDVGPAVRRCRDHLDRPGGERLGGPPRPHAPAAARLSSRIASARSTSSAVVTSGGMIRTTFT